MKKVFLFLIMSFFLISFVSATCTLTLDKDYPTENYRPSETSVVTANCDNANEKNEAYTITWTYPNGTTLEVDTGTTPIVQGTDFFETYLIPADYSGFFNVTMTGTDLEGEDVGNVSGSDAVDDEIEKPLSEVLAEIFGLKPRISAETGEEIDGGFRFLWICLAILVIIIFFIVIVSRKRNK